MPHTISIDLLRTVFTSANLPPLFEGKCTHEPALKLAAQLVRHSEDDDLVRLVIEAALPGGYGGDTVAELPEMISGARRKFVSTGEDAESAGGGRASILAGMISAKVKLFHTNDGRAFMAVPTEQGGVLTYPVDSSGSELLMTNVWYHSSMGGAPPRFDEVAQILKMKARFEGPEQMTFRRVGHFGDRIYIDLGDASGRCIEISADGWRLISTPPIAFLRDDGMRPLPVPVKGGTIHALKSILSLTDRSLCLLAGFMLNCLRGKPPFMFLAVEGQQGSGKSFLCDVAKRIIDPNLASKIRLPNNEGDLQVQANSYYLLVFDNASGMSGDISDSLCTLATGGAMAKRRLYSDAELSVIVVARPFIINGISDFISRPDLMERAIPLQLEALEKRRVEAELLAEFEDALPGILGALYDGVASALRDEKATPSPLDIRMIDAARWVTASESVLGFEPGSFVATLRAAQKEANNERVNNEPLVIELHRLLKDRPFLGYIANLFQAIGAPETRQTGMPKTPAQLSKTLNRLKPALSAVGIHLEVEERTKLGRLVRIWKDGQNPNQAKLSTPHQIPGQD